MIACGAREESRYNRRLAPQPRESRDQRGFCPFAGLGRAQPFLNPFRHLRRSRHVEHGERAGPAAEHGGWHGAVPAMGLFVVDHAGVGGDGGADFLDDVGLGFAGEGGGLAVALGAQDGGLALRAGLHDGGFRLAIGLGDAGGGLGFGLHLHLFAFVAHFRHGVFGADGVVLGLDGGFDGGLEAGAVGDAAELQVGDFQAEDAAERVRDVFADGAGDLFAVGGDVDCVLGGEHAQHAVGQDRADILVDVDVAGAADIVQQLEHGRAGDAVGHADTDRDRLVVDRVNRQVVELEDVEAGLDRVHRVDPGHFHVQSGADRLAGQDGAEAAHAGHFGGLHGVEAVRQRAAGHQAARMRRRRLSR